MLCVEFHWSQSKIQCPSGSQDYRAATLMSQIRRYWKGQPWICSDPWSDHPWTPFCSPTSTGDLLDRLASPVRVMSSIQGLSSPSSLHLTQESNKSLAAERATVPTILRLLVVGRIWRGDETACRDEVERLWGAKTVTCCSTPPTRRWHNRGNIRPLNIGRDCVEMVLNNRFYPTAVTTLTPNGESI